MHSLGRLMLVVVVLGLAAEAAQAAPRLPRSGEPLTSQPGPPLLQALVAFFAVVIVVLVVCLPNWELFKRPEKKKANGLKRKTGKRR